MDVFHVSSKTRPLVIVHKDWKNSGIRPEELNPVSYRDLWVEPIVASLPLMNRSSERNEAVLLPQKFEFVNGTTLFVNREAEVRKLVRAHVVRDSSRKKKQRQQINNPPRNRALSSADNTSSSNTASDSTHSSPIFSDDPSDQAIALSRSSIPSPGLDPHPALSPIIYHVTSMGTAMWPLEGSVHFNPISPAKWWDWALSDEALFHALLYTTSTYAGLITGSTESKEAIVHEGKSMSLVNQRLSKLGSLAFGQGGDGIEEGTIGAVSCLAITEALRGDLERWKIHMSGVKQMVLLKGGLSKVGQTLQLKMHRADLTGAVAFLATPFFALENGLPKYASPTRQNTTNKHILQFLNALPIDQSLVTTLTTLSTFSQYLSLILANPATAQIPSQMTLLKETYGLRYALLQPPDIFQVDTAVDITLSEILRLGALLYIQATLQELPHSALGSRNLIARLKELVVDVKIRNREEGELMVWLLIVGAMEAGDMERAWFVEWIGRLARRLGIEGWEEVRSLLNGLWWVEAIHGAKGRKLWEDVLSDAK